jgi:GxxExxY protein
MLVGQDAELTETIIGCGIRVHREFGPGILESVNEEALCIELRHAGLTYRRQIGFPMYYRGELIGEFRPDLIVQDRVVVEVKSVEAIAPIHKVQLLTYLKVTGLRTGLGLNFNTAVLKDGIYRVVR